MSALNLADLLGAASIFLVGFDMRGDGVRTANWHDDYPDEWKGFVAGIASAGLMADVIGSTLPLPPEEKIALLAETTPGKG